MPDNRLFSVRQLGLQLGTEQDQTFSNFVAGTNASLCEFMRASDPLHYGYGNSMYLWAGQSSGKSHLLRAYCFYWQERGIRIDYVDAETAFGRRFALGASGGRAAGLVIDNIQFVRPESAEEEELLSFLKESAELDKIVMLSGDRNPAKLNTLSDDLVSRLLSFYVFRVHPLKGNLLKDFVRLRAEKLGVHLDRDTETLLFRNCSERGTKFVGELLRRLAVGYDSPTEDRIRNEITVMCH